MNMKEYHTTRRKKFAELNKSRVDAAYEYYCSLSDEDKQIAEFTFACKLAKHLCVSISIARMCTTNLIAEYNIEFCKNKNKSNSFRICWTSSLSEVKSCNWQINYRT